MTRYFVIPRSKGYGDWSVKTEGGKIISNHRLQKAAIERAQKEAGPNDAVNVMCKNGTFRSY